MFRCPEEVDVHHTRYGMLSLLTLKDESIAALYRSAEDIHVRYGVSKICYLLFL